MSDTAVHLQLTGRIAYEDDITIGLATQIIALIHGATHLGMSPSSAPASPTTSAPAEVTSRQRTVANPREALDVCGAKTNAERIVALAAYVLQDGEFETFTLDSIRPLFRRAREVTPKNITRDLDGAIRAGWIGEGDAKNELFLTAKSENVLEIGFDAIRAKRTGATPKARTGAGKKPRTTNKPEVFASIDTFPTTISGLPSYHQVKLKRDKALWAIKLAKDLGVPGLQNKDLVWLSDKLGEGIPSNDVNGHFRGLHRAGHVNRSTIDNVMRITEAGEGYLQAQARNDG
jgi:hypothetical protein